MSSLLALEAGVPQGSILGPLYYTIFTNELPQVVHGDDCPLKHNPGDSIFATQCEVCGGVCCYADDSTYTAKGHSPGELSEKLSEKYKVMADFLTDNKLKVNDDKTHLLVMTTRQKRRHIDTSTVNIITPSAIIAPSSVERLLGANIHQDMRWVEHVLDSDESLVKSLNTRLGALKKICHIASFKTRKTIANGIFMSKLIYLMPLWSGCEDYLVRMLQVVQNKAARVVTKQSRFTPTKTILSACGWMSVKQLLAYHSLVLLYRTVSNKKPDYLYNKVKSGGEYRYNTRQAESGSIRQGPGPSLDICKQSWCWKSVEVFNTLPTDLKMEKKLPNFKKRLKDWIKLNINT